MTDQINQFGQFVQAAMLPATPTLLRGAYRCALSKVCQRFVSVVQLSLGFTPSISIALSVPANQCQLLR